MIISQCVFSVNSTGQRTLNVSVGPGQPPEDAPEVAINVIEDESVTFRCVTFATLNVRRPGAARADFGTGLPDNLMPVGTLTFEFQNVSRSDNGTAVQCRGAGGATSIGVINVLCKLYFFRLGLC